jgi:hypothetical protein
LVTEAPVDMPNKEEKYDTTAHEELPDWLKGAETPSEISEIKTPESNV